MPRVILTICQFTTQITRAPGQTVPAAVPEPAHSAAPSKADPSIPAALATATPTASPPTCGALPQRRRRHQHQQRRRHYPTAKSTTPDQSREARVAATAHKKRTRRRPILAYCTCGPARESSVLRLVSLRVRRLQVQPLPPRCIAWSILLKD